MRCLGSRRGRPYQWLGSPDQSLPWLVREHTNPDIGSEMLAQRVTTLRHDLSDLGVLA